MTKYLKQIILVVLILIGINANALTPSTCDRNAKDNLGVNKKWQITDRNRSNVLRTPCVDAGEKIYDFSGVLSESEYLSLQSRVKKFINKYNTDLVIVIDDVTYYYDSRNEEYASDFYDYNDFGIETEKYDGILFFRNTYATDPYYDIYAFGNAQLYINQSRADTILDGVYDDLHNGRYNSGFNRLIGYLENYYAEGTARSNYTVDNNGFLKEKYQFPFIPLLGISLLITIIVIGIMIGKNKMVRKATTANEYIDKEKAEITNRKDQFVSTHTSVVHHSSSSGGGGGSHIGSSGGGHFSGGGRHG